MSRTWLVTGSSRGFGWELARAVLAAGDRLVATARSTGRIEELREEYGDRVRVVVLDVTDPAAARDAVAIAVAEFGALDVLVNNAGYGNSSPIEETPDEDFRAQVEANFFGVVNVTKAALPIMRRQRSGHIIQFSSIGGRVGGTPGMAAYQSAKFAVEGFSEVLASEVKPFGITVIIVEPGAFRTDWAGSSMTVAEVGEEYRSTVGTRNAALRTMNGSQNGDPARGAQVIIDVLTDPAPPRRLLLGSDALRIAREAGRARADELEKWAAVTASTDY